MQSFNSFFANLNLGHHTTQSFVFSLFPRQNAGFSLFSPHYSFFSFLDIGLVHKLVELLKMCDLSIREASFVFNVISITILVQQASS